MFLRVAAFLLSFALWVYYGVIRNELPIRPESFSVRSLGMSPMQNETTLPSSSSPSIPHRDPFEVRLPISIPTIAVKPAVTFNESDVWKWDGLIDYDRVTANCVNRFRNAMPYYVIYRVESTVGFANQFRSLIGVFLIALVSNRRLRIDWDDYYNITSSAFTELRYDRNQRIAFIVINTLVKVPVKVYYRFERGFCNNTRYASFDVEKIFGARHLFFQTLSDLSCLVLPNPAYRAVLKELGFVVDHGDEILRGQIARILLTPNPELTYYIRQNLQAFDTEHVIGIQVRTGGWLASTFENGSFLRRTAVLKIGERVLMEMERRQWNQTNCKVFLTSDSNIAVRMITGSLKDQASVIVPSGYKPGHSSPYLDGRNHYTHLYRAIMDLVLLSQTTPVFWTYGSSYGLLGARLSLGENFDLRNSTVCSTL